MDLPENEKNTMRKAPVENDRKQTWFNVSINAVNEF